MKERSDSWNFCQESTIQHQNTKGNVKNHESRGKNNKNNDISGDEYVGIDDIFIVAWYFDQEENPQSTSHFRRLSSFKGDRTFFYN